MDKIKGNAHIDFGTTENRTITIKCTDIETWAAMIELFKVLDRMMKED